MATTGGDVVGRDVETSRRRVGALLSTVVRPAVPDDANSRPSCLSAWLASCAVETAAAADAAPVELGAAPAELDDRIDAG